MFLEFNKSIILFFSPVKGDSFLCQIMEWSSKCREVRDELSIEVTESDEGSDCFDRFR